MDNIDATTSDHAATPQPYIPPASIPLPSMKPRNGVGRVLHEDAMIILALLDLHRTVGDEEGRSYLHAARALGDDLVEVVLRRMR